MDPDGVDPNPTFIKKNLIQPTKKQAGSGSHLFSTKKIYIEDILSGIDQCRVVDPVGVDPDLMIEIKKLDTDPNLGKQPDSQPWL